MTRHIHHKSMLEGIQNIYATVIDPQRPELADDIDIVFICDVLHHIENRVDWLSHIANQLKAGSRFYMIEFREGGATYLATARAEGRAEGQMDMLIKLVKSGLL